MALTDDSRYTIVQSLFGYLIQIEMRKALPVTEVPRHAGPSVFLESYELAVAFCQEHHVRSSRSFHPSSGGQRLPAGVNDLMGPQLRA